MNVQKINTARPVNLKLPNRFGAYQNYLMDAVLLITIFSVQPVLKKFLLEEVVNSTKDINHYSAEVGWLYVATALAQGIGALMVQKPVAVALQSPHRPSYYLLPLVAMLIMHFIIFGILFWVDGVKYIGGGHIPFWTYPFLFFPTIAVILVIIPSSKRQIEPRTFIEFVVPFIGCLLLALSALVSLTLFWNLFIEGLGKDLFSIFSTSHKSGFQIFFSKVLLTLLFAILFLLFYAPARIVFFATDWHKRKTWVSTLLIFLPFAIGLWTGE